MKRTFLCLLIAAGLVAGVVLKARVQPEDMSVEQIIDKNVAARGGLDAWRKVQVMVWSGHIESARTTTPRLPFALAMKRPNKTRFEVPATQGHSMRIFDGHQGWKMHPNDSGQPELKPYSDEEVRLAVDGQGFDGPLIDMKAKGVSATLEGIEEVEGQKAFRLQLKLPSGDIHHLWIDTRSFLDIQFDRETRNTAGVKGMVVSVYRDYRSVQGLKLPFVVETGVGSGQPTDKMVIEQVIVDPPLADAAFERPNMPSHRAVVALSADPAASDSGNLSPRPATSVEPAARGTP